LTCHLAVVVLSYCQQRYEAVICLSLPTNPGQSHAGVTCTPPGTQWPGWVCRNVTSLGLSPSGYGLVVFI